MKVRTDEQAQQIIDSILRALQRMAEADEGEEIAMTDNAIAILLSSLQLVAKFMYANIYEVVEYNSDNVRLNIVSRMDTIEAFKRHTLSLLTNVCQECGEPMDTHDHKDDPPHRSMH